MSNQLGSNIVFNLFLTALRKVLKRKLPKEIYRDISSDITRVRRYRTYQSIKEKVPELWGNIRDAMHSAKRRFSQKDLSELQSTMEDLAPAELNTHDYSLFMHFTQAGTWSEIDPSRNVYFQQFMDDRMAFASELDMFDDGELIDIDTDGDGGGIIETLLEMVIG